MTAVVLTHFTFLELLRAARSPDSRSSVFFFDLYNRTNGAFVILFVRLFGHERVSSWIETAGRGLGVKVQRVPHGDAVPDYHAIQLTAERQAKECLTRFHASSSFQRDISFPPGVIEDTSADSLYLKTFGRWLWNIFENLEVVRASGVNDISLWVPPGRYPGALLSDIADTQGITIFRRPPRGRILNLLVFGCLISVLLLRMVPRVRSRVRAGVHTNPGPFVAVEFVDPRCNTGRATEPNYIVGDQCPPERILGYYRGAQERRVGSRDFSLDDEIRVVRLRSLPIAVPDAAIFMRACARVLLRIWRNSLPVYCVQKDLEDMELFVELSSLFRLYPIKVHLYNKIPNGRASTRRDPGLVTGLCRKFGIYSLSYQSRTYYRHNVYYFFDAFDEFCMWGDDWVNEYNESQFVEKFSVIGNVHLDSYSNSRGNIENIEELGNARRLVVFTSDIDLCGPSHYTLEYTKIFLLDTFLAVGEYNQENPGEEFEIVLKTKDPSHSSYLLAQPEISEALKRSGVRLNAVNRARHDVESVIRIADKVLAIGFTSPCFDALGLGKPGIYYTPYRRPYNAIFEGESPLVVHDATGIKAFLGADFEVDRRVLDGLDPFRDGNASERLAARIKILLGQPGAIPQ